MCYNLSKKEVTLNRIGVTNVLKRPPEERNVENNSDICGIVSSIVFIWFVFHHKNKNLQVVDAKTYIDIIGQAVGKIIDLEE